MGRGYGIGDAGTQGRGAQGRRDVEQGDAGTWDARISELRDAWGLQDVGRRDSRT